MSTGQQGNLIHSPIAAQGQYAYRSKAGLIPSAEHAVYFNDFFENPASNAIAGTTVIKDTNGTIVAAATDAYSFSGVIKGIDGVETTAGAANYFPKGIQLGLNKKFFMEMRFLMSAAADSDCMFGLTDLSATTNPEDLWTTASSDLIAFGVLDGDATVSMLCDKNNSGSSAELGTDDVVNDTWVTLGFEVTGTAANGTMGVKGYVNGQLSVTWSTETTIPDDLALAPFFGYRNGSATANYVLFDYIRWSIERGES